MDTADPQIRFDANGICNHCTEFIETRLPHRINGNAGKQHLDKMFDAIRQAGKGQKYDCIIGLSGGIDSSYALYLVREAGLRPLAVHMDNGWNSEISVSNIENLTKKLDVDYECFVLDWDEFRDLQVAFLKASVPEAETPTDVAILGAVHHYAAKYGVKYIVSAGNLATEGLLPKSWHYNARDLRYLNHIQRAFGTVKLKRFPIFDYKLEAYYKFVKGVRIVYPMNYIGKSQDEVVDLLRALFDYRTYGEKHHESRYTKFIQSYYLVEKFGMDYRRSRYSSEICAGLTSRNDAVEKLAEKPYNEDEVEIDKVYISKKLGISPSKLESLIARPPKYYWDYPNDEQKLKLVYSLYRKLFNKKQLSSS